MATPKADGSGADQFESTQMQDAPPPTMGFAKDPTNPAFSVGASGVDGYPFLSQPQTSEEIGRLGEYRVLAKLGEGGMGYVFRAEDPGLKRLVALKVMRPEVATKPLAAERFLREGRAAAAIKSDHVVTIYQVGQANGVPFLTMEFLEGQSLDAWMRAKRRSVTIAHAIHIVRDTLKGLTPAHDKGLVHRDIKPANLWIEKGTTRVKILDFGLTRGSESEMQLTQEGAVVGTPAYMAPEQAGGKSVDSRADLFSVGTIAYHLLAGQNPFARDSILSTLGAVGYDVQPPVTTARPDVPAVYSDFLDRLLAKNPNDRPANARAALAELTAIEKQAAARPTNPTMPPSVAAMVVPEQPTEVVDVEPEIEEKPIKPARVKRRTETVKSRASAKRSSKSPLWIGGAFAALAAVIVGIVLATSGGNKSDGKTAVAPITSTPSDEVNRKAAEFVLAGGGQVRVEGRWRREVASLPTGAFAVQGVAGGRPVTDADLTQFRSLAELTDLALLGPITDAGLQSLSQAPWAARLTRLSLTQSKITDDGLAALSRFSQLDRLELAGTPTITGRGLVHLKGHSLAALDLSAGGLLDDEMAALKHLAGLKSLKLDRCANLTNVGVATVARLTLLEDLSFGGLGSHKALTGASLSSLGSLSELKRLEVSLLDIGVKDVQHLSGLDKLERLSLIQSELNDDAFRTISRLKGLKDLNVMKNNITGDAIRQFRLNRGLVRIRSDFSEE